MEELSASLEEANRQLQDVMQSHDALAHANEQMERQLEITQQELDGVKQEYEHAVCVLCSRENEQS